VAVTGAHVLLYTAEADAVRGVLSDVFGWKHVDAGHGWLIFALPPAEVAVHPADAPAQEMYLMCDDLDATMAELRSKGVEFRGEPANQGWGVVTTMVLPGGLEMGLYQPRHPTAF
jgi:predicted enzyme related to lactoylglutathione lyase